MKAWQLAIIVIAIAVSAHGSSVDTASGLPSERSARAVLNSTPRHREWVSVPVGSTAMLAFVVYPERSDKAPVVVVTEQKDGASDWIRAVSDQVAAEGFIAVVPELLIRPESRADVIDAVRRYAVALPAATGQSADLQFDRETGRAVTGSSTFSMDAKGWREAIAYLNAQTNNRPVFAANQHQDEHAEHYAMMAMARQAARPSPSIQIALGEKGRTCRHTSTRPSRRSQTRNSEKNGLRFLWETSSCGHGSSIPKEMGKPAW